ncbi:type I-MYXAN CRISPR-associated protein Cas6/Cmx6 [Singulisphaera rosea]
MPMIDLGFKLEGQTIPLDHGYSLFSALCRIVPHLHGDKRIGIHPIRGVFAEAGRLKLTEQSLLRIRLPSDEIAPYLALAGSEIDVDGHTLRIGIPRAETLVPAATLASRLVTFRGALTPPQLESSLQREFSRLQIGASATFVPSDRPPWVGQPKRRILRIKEKRIVGYAIRVVGLSSEESIRLQEEGLGGRRRMGCGVFLPFTTGSPITAFGVAK